MVNKVRHVPKISRVQIFFPLNILEGKLGITRSEEKGDRRYMALKMSIKEK